MARTLQVFPWKIAEVFLDMPLWDAACELEQGKAREL